MTHPRLLLKSIAVAAWAALPLVAAAQLTGNIALTSNYKFRGQDQDASKTRPFKPALQGGVDYAFGESGWYVGNWNSTVDWLPRNKLEMDFYGGYKFKLGGVAMDVGALAYVYPGQSAGNTTELYVAGGYGPLTAKYAHTVSKDYFTYGRGGNGRGTGYLNVALAHEVLPKLTLKAALGFTHFARGIREFGVPHFTDYSLGGVYDLGDGLMLGAALVGADKQGYYGYANRTRVVATLTKNF